MTIDKSFKVENILRLDQVAVAAKQDGRDNCSLQCPHCRQLGTFRSALPDVLDYEKHPIIGSPLKSNIRAKIMLCPNQHCKGIVFVVEHRQGINQRTVACFPPQIIDFDPTDIPEALVRTLREAIVCHSQSAYRASAMMVRRLLEELCDDVGAEGRDLHQRLRALRDKITMPEDLFDGMAELKTLGNDAAHIQAKAYMNIDQEESELSIEVAKEILKARYQHKSLIGRLKARRNISDLKE